MHIFYDEHLTETSHEATLTDDEFTHAVKSLRLKLYDNICIYNGKGLRAEGAISQIGSKTLSARITEVTQATPRRTQIHLVIAPTKNLDRIEWLTEKCVEMGIDAISFIQTKNSERTELKTERLQRIAVSAMKQSKNLFLPRLGHMRKLGQVLENLSAAQKFIAEVPKNQQDTLFNLAQGFTDACILIGPEGGFTPEEVAQAQAAGFRLVSLGNTRLRTETAGLVACCTLNLLGS